MRKVECQITETGYLHIPAEEANKHFNTGAIIVQVKQDHLILMPTSYVGAGGLILKYRNAKGDRTVFIDEILPDDVHYGPRKAEWDEELLAYRVSLHI